MFRCTLTDRNLIKDLICLLGTPFNSSFDNASLLEKFKTSTLGIVMWEVSGKGERLEQNTDSKQTKDKRPNSQYGERGGTCENYFVFFRENYDCVCVCVIQWSRTSKVEYRDRENVLYFFPLNEKIREKEEIREIFCQNSSIEEAIFVIWKAFRKSKRVGRFFKLDFSKKKNI